MRRIERWLVAGTIAAAAAAAVAAETQNYSYDARGRLTKVTRSGSANKNVNTSYTFDKADNRTNRTTTGVP
ncbi:MAG: hypothetical protein ACT4OE_01450 [Sphingosinicella sp.]